MKNTSLEVCRCTDYLGVNIAKDSKSKSFMSKLRKIQKNYFWKYL